MWNGAADTLNKNPITAIEIPIAHGPRPSSKLSTPPTDRSAKILSRLVSPVKAYTNAEPRRINPDDRPPSRKYLRPADVADSESRYNVAKI